METPKSLYDLPPGDGAPETVNAVVEVPMGTNNKFEYDKRVGAFRLDRVLYSPMHYPGDYGFVPSTLAEDGDPVDVLALMDRPTYPGIVMSVRPLGYLEMTDEKGRDQKVLAVPEGNPRFAAYRSLADVPQHRLREIEHFFRIYKELEGKTTIVEGWRPLEDAHRIIVEAIARRSAQDG